MSIDRVALLLFIVLAAPAIAAPPEPLDRQFRLVADAPLGPRTSRVDYQSLDPGSGRLFIAGMGAARLVVFDTRAEKLMIELEGFPKVTGVLAVPELGKLYASVPGGGIGGSLSQGLGAIGLSSGSGRIAILDLATLREIARVPGGVFPDGIAFDPANGKVYVSDEMGDAVTVIDGKSDKVIARIETGGEVGNVRYDPTTQKVYAPIQTRDELAVIDPVSDRLVTRFKLPGAKHPHGLAIAPGAALGYVACDGNDRLLVVDLVQHKVTQSLPLGHDPDVLAIDEGLKRLYVAAESGTLASFDIADTAAPKALGLVAAGKDAHSVVADPASHKLYLPLAEAGGGSVLRILAPKSP